MIEHKQNELKKETAVLVGVITPNNSNIQVNEHLDELKFLAKTSGAKTLKTFVQKLSHPDSKTFVGKGKLQEIATFIKQKEIDIAIFDDELSGSQMRNIERVLDCKILDRSNLILDIFATHARTAQSKTQVELAQYEYLLPRLTRMWTHLSKQKGGIGMKGPGEKEIETDRRLIRNRISLLKKQLQQIDKQNTVRRKKRGELIRVALVGYTNAGKSTIMNLLSKSQVLVHDQLFATLDTTTRKVVINNLPFLLSDTVGFIRKLPHNLIESFKSTLDEVRESDILIHIVDISNPLFEEHITVVNETLLELGAKDKPILLVLNKIDQYKNEDSTDLNDLENSWMKNTYPNSYMISALKKTNMEEFRNAVFESVKEKHLKRYPYMSNEL
ncbi:MAG: GTPase HflX [Bacteroidia bacterium]|nr:GTPase HflX [Bacteroidia bacterium]